VEFREEQEIGNANLVIDHFGYWPSFHNAEVISICYKRNFQESNPIVEIRIYAFEMTDKLKGRHYELIKHCIIEFELIGVYANSMDGFNHQNALSGIDFDREGEWLICELHSAYGVDAEFSCKRILVKGLTPVDENSVQQ
jgi:hypothetical protein